MRGNAGVYLMRSIVEGRSFFFSVLYPTLCVYLLMPILARLVLDYKLFLSVLVVLWKHSVHMPLSQRLVRGSWFVKLVGLMFERIE